MSIISIYGAHDASVCFKDKNKNIRIFELERFIKQRYAALTNIYDIYPFPNESQYINFLNLIKQNVNDPFTTCYYNNIFDNDIKLISNILQINEFKKCDHHRGHALCSFYQSPFEESLIISFDGGGHDQYGNISYFNIYYGNKKNHTLNHIKKINLNFGTAYGGLGIPITEIKKSTHTNSYAGKLMGLSAYGKVINKWVDYIKNYYYTLNIQELFDYINLKCGENTISEFDSYNLAATSQFVFEILFIQQVYDVIKEYNMPICLSGGCALNVLNNQNLKNHTKLPIYIPPNPNDSGLSFGFYIDNQFESNECNITFSGIDIINIDKLETYKKVHRNDLVDYEKLSEYILDGNIVSTLIENSECGPRALGNRSIICYPSNPDLKNLLNSKIKFREWFRPFAPVVLLEDVSLYFDFNEESKYMSFCPKIRSEYSTIFPAITHFDNTCRVQTVTESNKLLYSLLKCLKNKDRPAILLNTSFNIKGKPLITDLDDAFHVLNTLPIDALIVNSSIFYKNNKLG